LKNAEKNVWRHFSEIGDGTWQNIAKFGEKQKSESKRIP